MADCFRAHGHLMEKPGILTGLTAGERFVFIAALVEGSRTAVHLWPPVLSVYFWNA